jgi:SAM-dependent methyltransferase
LTARDGSPVELYRRLPYGGEVERFAPFVPSEASVLELGCGAGRITRALLERDFQVTAVDNCAEMLASVPPDARPVLSDIETLDLGESFDLVLLASHLINAPEQSVREGLLAACRRHLEPGGLLVLQRLDPQWLQDTREGPLGSIGPVSLFLEECRHEGDLVHQCLRYELAPDTWHHRFTVRVLGDESLARELAEQGFGPPEWLDSRATWALAKVATPGVRSR